MRYSLRCLDSHKQQTGPLGPQKFGVPSSFGCASPRASDGVAVEVPK